MKIRRILLSCIIALTANPVIAAVHPNAELWIPVLRDKVSSENAPFSWELYAAQIDKETCGGANSPKCWNPKTEFKTSREYGFGLGQLTNTPRYNNFEYVKTLDDDLANWEFENRFDAENQILALLAMDKVCLFPDSASLVDSQAFMLACYNGGRGGVISDKLICKNTKDCDPRKWFGHVENTSNKSRQKWNGYGKSAFDINRDYPRDILFYRIKKYQDYRRNRNL